MLRQALIVFNILFACVVALPPPSRMTTPSLMMCVFYEGSSCLSPSGCNVTTEVCPPAEPDKRTHCYALWTNDSSGHVTVVMKGCWLDSYTCYDRPRCIETDHGTSGKYFCCCEGNMCNADVYLVTSREEQLSDHLTQSPGLLVSSLSGDPHLVRNTVMYALLPPAVLAFIIVFGFWLWRRCGSSDRLSQLTTRNLLSPVETMPSPIESSLGQINLQEVKAHGRFGCVWRAQTSTGHIVAVKVFPLQDQQSWLTERDFYSLTQVSCHDNVLRYFGSDRRSNEFWLVTEYHDHGSLCDYLKGNVVSIGEAITVALTMCRGLAFLHSSFGGKPIVAHRDFKSRNVLLRADFSVCIADFGLALILDHHPGDVHGQVGTRRYMSPEVLDGSINFSIEHFLKIDVYACALVLWEILSRCSMPEVTPSDYVVPFEDEVGSHPTLEEMQDTVVTQKKRPKLKKGWYQNEVTAVLCSTIEECWDHDPEARLSAECVEERLLALWETL